MKNSLTLQSSVSLFCINPATADGSQSQRFFDPSKRGQLCGHFDSRRNEPTSI